MKSFLFTSSFCKANLLQNTLDYLYHRCGGIGDTTHVIIDNHYPIEKENNRFRIRSLAHEFGCTYIDSEKDLGWHNGVNRAMKLLGVTPEDLIMSCDPDDRPSPGFTKTFKEVMTSDPSICVLGTNFSVIQKRNQEGIFREKKIIEGHEVWFHPSCEMWNVTAFNSKFIHDIGGFNEMAPYYGGLEAYLHQHWLRKSMRLAYVSDVNSETVYVDKFDPLMFDPEYRIWKDEVNKGYKLSFEELLKEKFPERLK